MLKHINDVLNVVKSSKVVINTVLIVPTQLLRNSRQTIYQIICILNPMMFKHIIVIIVHLYAQRVLIKLVMMILEITSTSVVIVICKIITITSIIGLMDSSSIINSHNNFSKLVVIRSNYVLSNKLVIIHKYNLNCKQSLMQMQHILMSIQYPISNLTIANSEININQQVCCNLNILQSI